MDFKMELTKLYNTLLTVETKGENTVVMADCLRFTKQLIDIAPEKQEEPKQAEAVNKK